MARRFRGNFTTKVDAKGRMSIPAPFRRGLEAGDPNWQSGVDPECVVVYGPKTQRHLEVYTVAAFEEVEDKILAMPKGSVKRKRLQRYFSGASHTLSIDNTGRIVLPQKLREKIGLDGDVFYLGTTDTFQIWNPAEYEALEEADESWLDDEDEEFDILSYLDEPEAEEA